MKTTLQRQWLSIVCVVALLAAGLGTAGSVVVAQGQETAEESFGGGTEAGFFAYSGGFVRGKRARTQTAAASTSSTAFVSLGGAALGWTVPASTSDLFNIAFSAECQKFGGGAAIIRILRNGVPVEPYDGTQIFCSSGATATYKGNWVVRAGPGTHTLQVQFRNTAGSLIVDDWTFELVVYD